MYIIIKLLLPRRMGQYKEKNTVFDGSEFNHFLQSGGKSRLYFTDTFVPRKFRKLRFVLERSDNLARIFHWSIITIFLLSVSGCGYKADPYYEEAQTEETTEVEFILKEKTSTTDEK